MRFEWTTLGILILGLGIVAGCKSGGKNSSTGGVFLDEPTVTTDTDGTDDGLVDVCHRPDDNVLNAHTIRIAPELVAGHLAHGDALGRCVQGTRCALGRADDGDDDDDDDAL